MDTSVSSQVDDSLKDTVTDGEEDCSDVTPSPTASDPVRAHGDVVQNISAVSDSLLHICVVSAGVWSRGAVW